MLLDSRRPAAQLCCCAQDQMESDRLAIDLPLYLIGKIYSLARRTLWVRRFKLRQLSQGVRSRHLQLPSAEVPIYNPE